MGTAVCSGLSMNLCPASVHGDEPDKEYQLNYLLASSMYGRLPIDAVVAEVRKTGSAAIDVWREPHANHVEQIREIGYASFESVLKKHDVSLAMTTIWRGLYPSEVDFLKRFKGKTLVTGFVPESGKNDPADINAFLKQIDPVVRAAEAVGAVVAIENHGASFDDIRRFADVIESKSVGIALAPYHLPQDAEAIAKLIEDIGPRISLFYAWQHGKGSSRPLPEDQLLQLPGRGDLDFGPILAALKKVNFNGWTEIFMHPTPRGIPIRKTADLVTAEINRSRAYLDDLLSKV